MGFGLLLRLVGLMNSYSLYFVHSVFKGDNSAYVVLFKKNKNKNLTVACIQIFTDQFLSILSFKVRGVGESNNLCANYLTKFSVDVL